MRNAAAVMVWLGMLALLFAPGCGGKDREWRGFDSDPGLAHDELQRTETFSNDARTEVRQRPEAVDVADAAVDVAGDLADVRPAPDRVADLADLADMADVQPPPDWTSDQADAAPPTDAGPATDALLLPDAGDGAAPADAAGEIPGIAGQCHITIGPQGDEPFDLEAGDNHSVEIDENGYLKLENMDQWGNLLWIPNTAENTVSKLDGNTGQELARYEVCWEPSAVAVGLTGNAWIGCRKDGGVAHIAVDEVVCPDKDGDGEIQTSKDANGNGTIEPDEMLPKGEDECVLHTTYPGGSTQTAADVDKDNHAWVAEYNGKVLRRLAPQNNGAVLQTVNVMVSPVALVMDAEGVMWVVSDLECKLVRAAPDAGGGWAVKAFDVPGCCSGLQAVVVDANGKIWCSSLGCDGKLFRFDPDTQQFSTIQVNPAFGDPSRLATSTGNHMYVGHHTAACVAGRSISKIDINAMQVVDVFETAAQEVTGPTGVAVAKDGHVWAVNQCTDNATRFDHNDGTVLGTYPVGEGPDANGGLTTYALCSYCLPSGYYQHTVEAWAAGSVEWAMLSVDAEFPEESSMKVQLRASDTLPELQDKPWDNAFGPFPPEAFPLDLGQTQLLEGKHLEFKLTLMIPVGTLYENSPVVKSVTVDCEEVE